MNYKNGIVRTYVVRNVLQLRLFAYDGSDFTGEALEDSMYFILSGEPLNGPIASYGSCVMNTMGEIQQAMLEFSSVI